MKHIETVYVVFKMNLDIGFTDLARNVVEKLKRHEQLKIGRNS